MHIYTLYNIIIKNVPAKSLGHIIRSGLCHNRISIISDSAGQQKRMIHMKRKILSLITAAAVAMPLMAGCSVLDDITESELSETPATREYDTALSMSVKKSDGKMEITRSEKKNTYIRMPDSQPRSLQFGTCRLILLRIRRLSFLEKRPKRRRRSFLAASTKLQVCTKIVLIL